MSRTYKYPRNCLEDSISRNEARTELRIKKRLEIQKQKERKKVKVARLKRLITLKRTSKSRE